MEEIKEYHFKVRTIGIGKQYIEVLDKVLGLIEYKKLLIDESEFKTYKTDLKLYPELTKQEIDMLESGNL